MLQGKVVIVTGAGGGIGAEIAKASCSPLDRSNEVFTWDPV